MKNVLFITWDGPQTTYMEGLFMPIFAQIQKQSQYRFHVIQFNWGSKERVAITQIRAHELNIIYTSKRIVRKPNTPIGSLLSVYLGIPFVKNYIENNSINIVMPRSIIPAIMVNRLKTNSFKILFDADGLPIEERVDFSNLKKSSYIYHFLQKEEKKMLQKAETVITRTKKAILYHLEKNNALDSTKFFVVINGRDENFFNAESVDKKKIREELDLRKDTKVFLYCGSLGPQYGWNIMLKIFKQYLQINHNAIFLFLTNNIDFAKKRIPMHLQNHIIIKSCPFNEIPKYMSIGDVAFAIREPKPSMQGVAPIKLGEYLLMGIPTLASLGIGDTEELLSNKNYCYLYNHEVKEALENALIFIDNTVSFNQNELRELGIHHFSMKSSVLSYLNALNHCS